MENLNTMPINKNIVQGKRLLKLNQIAIQRMRVLEGDKAENYSQTTISNTHRQK